MMVWCVLTFNFWEMDLSLLHRSFHQPNSEVMVGFMIINMQEMLVYHSFFVKIGTRHSGRVLCWMGARCLFLQELEDGVKPIATFKTLTWLRLTKQLMKAMWVTGCFATWAGKKAWYTPSLWFLFCFLLILDGLSFFTHCLLNVSLLSIPLVQVQ